MSDHSGNEGTGATKASAETGAATESAPRTVSRRALLRTTAAAAVPTILTLQSGAALAKSSNLLGTVNTSSRAIGPSGRIQCIDGASAVDGTPSKLDLGNNPMLHVQYVTQRQYYRPNWRGSSGDASRPVSIDQMCKDGGVYWYVDKSGWSPTWKSTTPGYNNRGVEKGFLVSAAAMTSFASAIKVKTTF